MLHAMFSGRFDTKPAEDGSYFIDRDGTNFRYILNYLWTGYLLIPDDKLIRKEILEEAEFYQIRGIVNQLHPPPFLGSKILSDEQKQFILNSCLKGQLDLRHSSFVCWFIVPQGTGGNTSTSMPIAIIRDQLLPWSRVGIIFLEGIQSSHRMVSTQLLLKKYFSPSLIGPCRKEYVYYFHMFCLQKMASVVLCHVHRLFCFLYCSLIHKGWILT